MTPEITNECRHITMRMARVIVSKEMFCDLLGLPPDAVVIGVRDTDNLGSIELKVTSKQFSPVSPGGLIPIVEIYKTDDS